MTTQTLYYPEGWDHADPLWTDSNTTDGCDPGPVRESAEADPDQRILALTVRPATEEDDDTIRTSGLDGVGTWTVLARRWIGVDELIERIETARG